MSQAVTDHMDDPVQWMLLRALHHDRFCTGTALGQMLGMTKANVWKRIESLRQMGIPIDAIQNKGYRLNRPLQLLDETAIRSHLKQEVLQQIDALYCLKTIDSTNRYTQTWALTHHRQNMLCLAEQQTDGKGRLGKRWYSPFGQNIYLSCLKWLNPNEVNFSTLSLAISLAVADTINEHIPDRKVQIKWPNDILIAGQKVAGILIESNIEANEWIPVVMGVGVNLDGHQLRTLPIDQPWIDLSSAHEGIIDRNTFAARLIIHLYRIWDAFEHHGFHSLLETWHHYDALRGHMVSLLQGQQRITGEALGIDASGALKLRLEDGRVKHVMHGVAHHVRPHAAGQC